MIPLLVIAAYLALLIGLGVVAGRFFRGTGRDYLLASHTIGPFLLLMSLFGTTMTAFTLIGSTGEAWRRGVVVYGLMASSSGIMHSLCFYLLGPRLWAWGRRYGYTTQIQFFTDRLQSRVIGVLLFPILVGLVIPYLLIGVMSAGIVINGVSRGAFEHWSIFEEHGYGVPAWLGSLVICLVVLGYVFFGGMRATAWANTLQTMVFVILGVVTFLFIAGDLGGIETATRRVFEVNPEKLAPASNAASQREFLAYLLIPLSVGMFPHIFQHWLTARRAATFKLAIVAHPLFIMILWLPCVLIGVWATTVTDPATMTSNRVLIHMVDRLNHPALAGLLTAGILAAIMSSLDSQFLCIGTIFTKDVAERLMGGGSERRTVWLARSFVVAIVAITFLLSLAQPRTVFSLGIWCFSGFSGLFPLAVAAVFWRRLTAAGAIAAIAAAFGTWFVLFARSNFGLQPGFTWWGWMPVVWITLASTAAMIGVSLLTRPPSEQVLAKFFPTQGE